MKTTALFIFALAAAVALSQMYTPGYHKLGATAALAGEQNPLIADSGVYVEKTCSGDIASTRPNVFVLGLRNDTGRCMTRNYLANSEEEAYTCAKKSCPDCSIEDITWMYGFSSSALGISDAANYCPSRK